MNRNRSRFWFLCALGVIAAVTRAFPHPNNVSPMAAVALFGAATFSSKRWGLAVPLLALMLSDFLLDLTFRAGIQPNWGFYPGQWVVYLCALVTIGIGFAIRGRQSPNTILAATLASSVIFFLVTNLVHTYGPDSIYPLTIEGLTTSYINALPFFANSLLGDLFFSGLLFGGLAFAESRFPALRAEGTRLETA